MFRGPTGSLFLRVFVMIKLLTSDFPIFRVPNLNATFGSTSPFVLDREHSRYRKFLQVQQNKFVLAEVALRSWNRFDNFWMWSIVPLYTTFGLWNKLNSVAATLSQYSVHLPIFQLPERHQNSVFDFTAIWHLFAVTKTTLGFYAKVASDRLSIAAPFTTESTPGRSSRT